MSTPVTSGDPSSSNASVEAVPMVDAVSAESYVCGGVSS